MPHSSTSTNLIPVVAYAVVSQGHLLLVRKRHTEKFMFPGGKLELGEQARDAIAREVQEELGCQIDDATVTFLGEFVVAAANEPGMQIAASVYSGQLLGQPTPCNEIEELLWLDLQQPFCLPLAPLVTDCVIPRLT